MGLSDPGMKVWLEPNDNPKRKLKFAWRLIEFADAWVGIDTSVPNKVVGDALRARQVPELAEYGTVRAEQPYGRRSRVDFLLSEPGLPDAYVEVKNCHLVRTAGLAEFPDSVTARGTKHLYDLAAEVQKGHKATMLFCVQRDDCQRFSPARDIDPAYAEAFDIARHAGVEVLAYGCRLDTTRIILERAVPVEPQRAVTK